MCNLLPDIFTLSASTMYEYLNPVDPMFLFLFIILYGHLCLFLLFQTFVVVDFLSCVLGLFLIESIAVSVVVMSSV